MARPEKRGLRSFSLDVDFFDDEKIETIAGEFGIKGEIVAIKLLCAIYRNGYFIEWSDNYRTKMIRNLTGISANLLDSIVLRLVSCGFFDKSIFDSTQVLTSRGIQRRYFSETRRRTRKNMSSFPYIIIEPEHNASPDIPSLNEPDPFSGYIDFADPRDEQTPPLPPQQIFHQPMVLASEEQSPNDQIIHDLQSPTQLRENLCMRFHLSSAELVDWFNQYILDCQCREIQHYTRHETLNHFFSWLRKSLTESNNAKSSSTNKRRGIETIPATTEDYNGTF